MANNRTYQLFSAKVLINYRVIYNKNVLHLKSNGK